MLAIARALLMNPKLVIMDEPSEGLAPVIVDHLIAVLRALPADGMGVLLVEQNLRVATEVAEEVAIMVDGPHRRGDAREAARRGPGSAAPLPRRRGRWRALRGGGR